MNAFDLQNGICDTEKSVSVNRSGKTSIMGRIMNSVFESVPKVLYISCNTGTRVLPVNICTHAYITASHYMYACLLFA